MGFKIERLWSWRFNVCTKSLNKAIAPDPEDDTKPLPQEKPSPHLCAPDQRRREGRYQFDDQMRSREHYLNKVTSTTTSALKLR
jgi:hypothetical protein